MKFSSCKKSSGVVIQPGALCISCPEHSGRVPAEKQHSCLQQLLVSWGASGTGPPQIQGPSQWLRASLARAAPQHPWLPLDCSGLGGAAPLLCQQLLCTAGRTQAQALSREELCRAGPGEQWAHGKLQEKVNKIELFWSLPQLGIPVPWRCWLVLLLLSY